MKNLKFYKVGTVDNFSLLHNFEGLHKLPADPGGNCGQVIYQYCTVHKCGSICGLGHRLSDTGIANSIQVRFMLNMTEEQRKEIK